MVWSSYMRNDVIATLCTMALQEQDDHPKTKETENGKTKENQDDMVIILSSDKDLMQLVTNPEENNIESSTSSDSCSRISSSGTIIQMMDPMTMMRIDHDCWGAPKASLFLIVS
jgi:5'-3' exonuclease